MEIEWISLELPKNIRDNIELNDYITQKNQSIYVIPKSKMQVEYNTIYRDNLREKFYQIILANLKLNTIFT